MDTNLKSNRKIRTIITIVILSLFAAGVVESYYVVRKNIASTFTVEDDVEECIERMDYPLRQEIAFSIARSQMRWMHRNRWN